jgi:hypothetical protein
MKLDWELLREQKAYLYNEACNNRDAAHIYEGVLFLIDAIQDEAIAKGDATEEEVFGRDFSAIEKETA